MNIISNVKFLVLSEFDVKNRGFYHVSVGGLSTEIFGWID